MNAETEFYKGFVIAYAKEFGWKLSYYKPEKELMGFRNKVGRCHIDVYLRSKRVITLLEHPKFGISILERTGVAISELRKIFEDPRVHTKNGRRI